MAYCKGDYSHIQVTCIEDKAWHDNDLYYMVCTKCGKTDRVLSKRPNQTIMRCEETK